MQYCLSSSNHINYKFFACIFPNFCADKLVTIEHAYIKDEARSRVDSYAIRNDMDTALLEWLILGKNCCRHEQNPMYTHYKSPL